MEKVLIVDDSKTICQILVDMMNSLGYENKAASDGLQALAMLKEEVFSVVISDIEMPGIDGLTLIKKIKEKLSGDRCHQHHRVWNKILLF